MEQRKLEREACSKGKPSYFQNPLYKKLTRTISKCVNAKSRADLSKEARTEIRSLLYEALKLRKLCRARLVNPEYSKIEYVRYADDWLVGVWGTKALAKSLRTEIANFLLSLKLTLSEEKTLITNTRLGRVKFLGTLIRRIAPTRRFRPLSSGNIWMTIPLPLITKRLKEKGFWKPGPKGPIPIGITKFIPLSIKELILRFRTILNGYLNYYSFSDNIRSLSYIYFLLHHSLRKTICRKIDIGPREFFAIYGPNITITIRRKDGKWVDLDFPMPKLTRNPTNFQGVTPGDPLRVKDWKISTLSAMGQCCANCESSENVEMHHLKHLKTINAKLVPLGGFGKLMAKINRKQVPLCRPCHQRVHKGEYAGMSLSHFKYLEWQGAPKWA